jgi:hypothetical protein
LRHPVDELLNVRIAIPNSRTDLDVLQRVSLFAPPHGKRLLRHAESGSDFIGGQEPIGFHD